LSDETYWAAKAQFVEDELLKRIPENKVRPRLEPTRRAAALLGDPQKSYRVIHVTGTNGKTSTTRFIERILREHGLRTGRFTSPHLVSMNERIAIDGEPVSNEQLYEVYSDITPVLEMVDAELEAEGDTKLTFFEALAVLGFAVFADAPVDVLVLEVGMGGEWDSTNVADGDVAVFTPISLDHTDRLGKTIAEIAATKAGIIKPHSIVVSSAQTDEALPVLRQRAESIADSLKVMGSDFAVLSSSIDGFGQLISVQGIAGTYRNLYLPLFGSYQAENLALAIAAVESFLGGGSTPLSDDLLRIAVADASSPGRLQVISREPITVIDAAHNPHGAQSLANAIRDFFDAPQTVGVVGVLGDKDAAGLLAALRKSFDHLILTKSSSPRALDENELARIAKDFFDIEAISVASNLNEAYQLALDMVPDDGAIVITGSVSMAGDMLKLVRQEDDIEESFD
jgi:dihydrofolate synthase/folylpolyglutamate synthase